MRSWLDTIKGSLIMSKAALLAAKTIQLKLGGGSPSLNELEDVHRAICQQDAERVMPLVSDAAIERACQAHWLNWGNMRPDNQAKWREHMRSALMAYGAVTSIAP
jgi:hypothetical protein